MPEGRKHHRPTSQIPNLLQFRPAIPSILAEGDNSLLTFPPTVPDTLAHVARAQQRYFSVVHLRNPKACCPTPFTVAQNLALRILEHPAAMAVALPNPMRLPTQTTIFVW